MRIALAFWSALSCAVIFAANGQAAADEPSGTAIAVIQATDVVGTGGDRVLATDAPVYTGDRVTTGASGQAQIRFRDDTKLVVGPGSSLVIDKFVFNSDGSARAVSMNVVRGTFRFISGTGPSSVYHLQTPTATLGLRGTFFDVEVRPSGETFLALHSGGVRFCDLANRCVNLHGGCSIGVAAPHHRVRRIDVSSEKAELLKANFPYIGSGQAALRSEFRGDTSSCSAAAAPGRKGILPISGSPG